MAKGDPTGMGMRGGMQSPAMQSLNRQKQMRDQGYQYLSPTSLTPGAGQGPRINYPEYGQGGFNFPDMFRQIGGSGYGKLNQPGMVNNGWGGQMPRDQYEQMTRMGVRF